MTTHTHNHLFLSTTWKAISGTWLGETSSWGWRFAVGDASQPAQAGRLPLDAGNVTLNQFDCHTDVASRSLTAAAVPGTNVTGWSGDSLPATEAVTQNDCDFFIDTAMAFNVAIRALLPTTYQLGYIKLYAVDAQGKAPLGPNIWTPTSGYAGTASSILSPEVAVCISHYSAHRAKAGRGRFYIGPMTQTLFSTDGLIQSSNQSTIMTAAKNVQNTVRTRGTPGNSAVYAGIVWNRTPGTTGSVINKVRVGDEPDHQERRTKARPEQYTEVNVT